MAKTILKDIQTLYRWDQTKDYYLWNGKGLVGGGSAYFKLISAKLKNKARVCSNEAQKNIKYAQNTDNFQ